MMRATKKQTNWQAFVEFMNQIYWNGCMEDFDSKTIAFHYSEFVEGHNF